MAELKLRGINKSFGAVPVIHNIDLDVADGEFVVFVGPSGCGKSTLLRTISGLEEANSGQVLIGGEDVTDFDPSERGVAMVFQSYALYPHMTVEQNLGFGLRMGGMPRDQVAARVAEAARILELESLLDRKPRQCYIPRPVRPDRGAKCPCRRSLRLSMEMGRITRSLDERRECLCRRIEGADLQAWRAQHLR